MFLFIYEDIGSDSQLKLIEQIIKCGFLAEVVLKTTWLENPELCV